MASMVFASSTLSAQSLVKLRTNSKYPPSSCYVPSYSKANSSYNVHLYYKFSHIESSKSSFTMGDGFSKFPPLLKFPRVASTLSPSLNIIKACSIYRYNARELEKNQDGTIARNKTPLDGYKGSVLLIINIPQQGSRWSESQIKYFNKLRQEIRQKHNNFEVLGFIYDKNELDGTSKEKRTDEQILQILGKVKFPIFETEELNKEYKKKGKPPKFSRDDDLKVNTEDVWYFLRNSTLLSGEKVGKIHEDFETFLLNQEGIPDHQFPRFEYGKDSQLIQPGGKPYSDSEQDKIKKEIKLYLGD